MLSLRLSEVAELVGGKLADDRDPLITGAAGIGEAGPGDLTFAARPEMDVRLKDSEAAAVIVRPGGECPLPAILVEDPYRAFARFLERLQMSLEQLFPPGVHPTAVVGPEVDIQQAAAVGPYCVIAAGCVVGAGSRLGAHVVLGPEVEIGRDCVLHAGVNVRERCRLGNRVVVHCGTVIGSDGFGYLRTAEGLGKIPQVGIVLIEDDVEVGAGVCVDRATTGTTRIGRGSKIDNLVQIGHNVKIGDHCALSAQTGISGSCTLGDRVTTGGQVGIGDHLTVGDDAAIGGQSGITREVPAGGRMFGTPALNVTESFRLTAALRRLPELLRRVARIERQVSDRDKNEE